MKHYKQFTNEQRYQISGMKKAGMRRTQIAVEIGVHKSAISREFGRNNGRRGWYPKQAQELRDQQRKKCVNAQRLSLPKWAEVERLIRLDMSPQQASRRLALEGGLKISHESISCTYTQISAVVVTCGGTCVAKSRAEKDARVGKSAEARSRTEPA